MLDGKTYCGIVRRKYVAAIRLFEIEDFYSDRCFNSFILNVVFKFFSKLRPNFVRTFSARAL